MWGVSQARRSTRRVIEAGRVLQRIALPPVRTVEVTWSGTLAAVDRGADHRATLNASEPAADAEGSFLPAGSGWYPAVEGELERYRSEFFGRLRAALGDRPDIQVVGDRFVVPTDILFDTGSAELGPAAQASLDKLAETAKLVAAEIPSNLDWVLRIDGHTDNRPIHTDRFPSNWELSSARAVSIVKYLVVQGIPAHRLSANGFGQFQPLDAAQTPEAFARNRRIEIQLTNR